MSKGTFKERMKWLQFRDRFILNAVEANGGHINCSYCNGELRVTTGMERAAATADLATLDHYVPRSKGGDVYSPSNLKISCYRCNKLKSDLMPEEWEKNKSDLIKNCSTVKFDAKRQKKAARIRWSVDGIMHQLFNENKPNFAINIKSIFLGRHHFIRINKEEIIVQAKVDSDEETIDKIRGFTRRLAPFLNEPRNVKVRGKILFANSKPFLALQYANHSVLIHFDNNELVKEVTTELGNKIQYYRGLENLSKNNLVSADKICTKN